MPTEEDFRALARSSPWLWGTVRFTATWRGRFADAPVRAWIDRTGGGIRVEGLDGGVLVSERQERSPGSFTMLFAVAGSPGDEAAAAQPQALAGAEATRRELALPTMRADGLVARRGWDRHDHDVPMYRNYHWVAMFDPVELTDGADHETGADVPGTVVRAVREVTHEGRPAWEAVVRPTSAYDPRCSCCALLPSAEADALDDWRKRDGAYPDAFRVRLDVGTGICVLSEELGGERAGTGHRLAIEAVDEEPDPALFGR